MIRPAATLAGAPPGAFLKADASINDTPDTVGTKSINSSLKETSSTIKPAVLSPKRIKQIPAVEFQLIQVRLKILLGSPSAPQCMMHCAAERHLKRGLRRLSFYDF